MLGGTVSNAGSIVADYGTVNLAAGRAATLDLAGDGLLRLEVGAELSSNGSGAASAVQNSGTIQANGGQVLLTASAVQRRVHEPRQQQQASCARIASITRGGAIQLLGPEVMSFRAAHSMPPRAMRRAPAARSRCSGERVGLFGNAVVDVSGATGGGTALIGGGDHGQQSGRAECAAHRSSSAGATINADAGATGDGGHVVVWSNDYTQYDGRPERPGRLTVR